MMSYPRLAAVALGALTLSACGSNDSETKGAAATSPVLKGSINDEMIDYDALKSEPPPAKEDETSDEGLSGSGGGSASGTSQSPASVSGPSEPTPTPEPAPEPVPTPQE